MAGCEIIWFFYSSLSSYQRAHIPRSLLQILEKDTKKDEKKPKLEKLDKEQIDPEEQEDSTKDDKSPKRSRSHTRESLKDKKKSRRSRSRSRSRSPRRKKEKSAGEESASEGEINWAGLHVQAINICLRVFKRWIMLSSGHHNWFPNTYLHWITIYFVHSVTQTLTHGV